MPSSEQQMPSAAADYDLEGAMLRARVRAGELLAARGVYGLVWLDEELVVRKRFGSIVDFIEVGAPVTQSVPPLVGLEAEIKALKGVRDSELRLPSVAIVTASGAGPRLNMFFFSFETEKHYMMVVSHADTGTNMEMVLSRQVRARLMAEAEASAKSKELARANADLTVANGNLEQFAAIVTPRPQGAHARRALHGRRDRDRDRRQRHARPRGQIGRAAAPDARLSSMLSALLHYSSAGPRPRGDRDVDTLALVTEIVRSLPLGGIDVAIRGDLAATGDARRALGPRTAQPDRQHDQAP